MEFSQFYFGSLLSNSNTFLRAWPQVHFEATFGLPMTPRRTVTEAAGSGKLVDGPAFTVDFTAGPPGMAPAPPPPGRPATSALAQVGRPPRTGEKDGRVCSPSSQV